MRLWEDYTKELLRGPQEPQRARRQPAARGLQGELAVADDERREHALEVHKSGIRPQGIET